MKNDLKRSLADIEYSTYSAKQDTMNSIFVLEMKNDMLDGNDVSTNCDVYYEAFADNKIPKDKDYGDYDFKNHNTTQGLHNKQFANALYNLYFISRLTHGDDTLRSVGDVYIPRSKANEMKYQRFLEVLKDYTRLKPNFVKLTYVSENVGKDQHGNPSIVLFADMDLPSGKYKLSLHFPRPKGSKTKTYKNVKQAHKKRYDAVEELENYNSPSISRIGEKDVDKYSTMESEYKKAMGDNQTSRVMINELMKAFDINTSDDKKKKNKKK